MADAKQIRLKFPKPIIALLDDHQNKEGITRTKLMGVVVNEFLEFWDAMTPEEQASYTFKAAPADSDGQYSPYVKIVAKERMDELSGRSPKADVYWTAILKYMQKNDLFESSYSATPQMTAVPMEHDTLTLLRVWVATKRFPSLGEIYSQAAINWMAKRKAFDGIYYTDYDSRPLVKDGDPDFVEHYIALPIHLYQSVNYWADRDSQPMRTVMYNALLDFLDDELVKDLEGDQESPSAKEVVEETVRKITPKK